MFLHSDCLNSKFGFSDGDLLDDLLDEASYDLCFDSGSHLPFSHEVLARIVETKLLPAMPPVETFRIRTCHNPIRAEGATAAGGFSVEITPNDVLEVARLVASEWGLAVHAAEIAEE